MHSRHLLISVELLILRRQKKVELRNIKPLLRRSSRIRKLTEEQTPDDLPCKKLKISQSAANLNKDSPSEKNKSTNSAGDHDAVLDKQIGSCKPGTKSSASGVKLDGPSNAEGQVCERSSEPSLQPDTAASNKNKPPIACLKKTLGTGDYGNKSLKSDEKTVIFRKYGQGACINTFRRFISI